LEDVAEHLLHCPEEEGNIEDNAGNDRLLKNREEFRQPVSRVYYMENDSIAIMSELLLFMRQFFCQIEPMGF